MLKYVHIGKNLLRLRRVAIRALIKDGKLWKK